MKDLDALKAKEIVGRGSTIPHEGEEFSDVLHACDLGAQALDKCIAKSIHPDGDKHILACSCCGSGEYLCNADGNRNTFCGRCGQKILWED